MYSILFHVGWLALIEIIFYFQYIGPLESDLFKDSIKNIINDYKIKNNDMNNNNNQFIIIKIIKKMLKKQKKTEKIII